jgi:hypothetical protein
MRVSFTIQMTEKGPRAFSIRLLSQ